MPRKEHKYHYIYKTVDLRNGNYYLGMHSTSDLEDGYLGSGKRLRHTIRKYGKENFKLEILEFLPNRESLVKREKELITEDIIKDPKCINLIKGGQGGFISEEQQRFRSLKAAAALKQKFLSDPESKKSWIEKIKLARKLATPIKHKEETKKKIGLANSKHQTGEKNSQFGTMWITNGKINKKIKKDSIIQEGWNKGRCYSGLEK